jgi:hypothetical protein
MKANYSRDNFSGNKVLLLEHFQKYCNHSVEEKEAAVLLGFGFVFAQSRQNTKIPRCRMATIFLQTL